jgi:CBS domain-containing protein
MLANRNVMTQDPITVRPDEPIGACARLMLKHEIRHLPVVTKEGTLVGVVDDVGVFRHGGLVGENHELWIPFDLSEIDDVAQALAGPIEVLAKQHEPTMVTLRKILHSEQDFAVIVNEGGKLVGIMTEHDGVKVARKILSETQRTLRIDSSAPVEVVQKDEPAHLTLERMSVNTARHMVIVGDKGKVLGVVSRGDLIAEDVTRRREVRVDDVARGREPITCLESATLADVAAQMEHEHIGCVPVVNDEHRPIAIITRTDLIEAAVASMEQQALFPSE